MNFLLPLLIGGPDMAKKKDPLDTTYTYHSIIRLRERGYYSTNNKKNSNKNKNNKQSKGIRTIKSSVLPALKRGWNAPIFPNKVLNIHNHPFTHIFRVIGGISIITLFSQRYLLFRHPFDYVILLYTLLHFIHIAIISIIKLFYGIRVLRSNKLEVRNSPLDRLETTVEKILYCWKYGCQAGYAALGLRAAFFSMDSILEADNREKIFIPLINFFMKGKPAYDILLGIKSDTGNLETSKTFDEVANILKPAEKALDSCSDFSNRERDELISDLNKIRNFEQTKITNLAADLIKKLENIQIKKKEMNNNFLPSYLAGLFEGDGHIWIPKDSKKKKHNPRFCITFGLKDELLAKNLIEILGYGFIRYKTKHNACVLTVTPVKGLKKIIEFINGELRTPKIIQLYNLIDWINKNHSSSIVKLPLKEDNLKEDSWLAGFVDADGSFSIQHTKRSILTHPEGTLAKGRKRKISCRLRIQQRMYEPISLKSYFSVLTEIAKFLNCNLQTRKQVSTGNEYFNITASSQKSLSIIISYFKSFPLSSSKYLHYKDWEEAAILILEKNHYTEQGIKRIDLLKNNMNLKRSYINRDPLEYIP